MSQAPSLTLAEYAAQTRSLARVAAGGAIDGPAPLRFGFAPVKLLYYWQKGCPPQEAYVAMTTGKDQEVNPTTLRKGDILDFGWGRRTGVIDIGPGDHGQFRPIGKDGKPRWAGFHQTYGWTGPYHWRGYEEVVERLPRTLPPADSKADFIQEVHRLGEALVKARNAMIGSQAILYVPASDRVLSYYWQKGFSIRATLVGQGHLG